MNPVTFGSLFAGIGGIDLGFERCGMKCRWQVEINDYAQKVLAKHWPKVHRERDIRECSTRNLERVDIIAGGFPCQDISYAGLGAGLDGERSGLFFEAIRLVRELQPRAVVLENVAALLTRGLDRVLGTLAEIGYDAEWHCIPAAYVGAPHIRDRVFVIAYARCQLRKSRASKRPRSQAQAKRGSTANDNQRCGEDVADTAGVYAQGLNNRSGQVQSWRSSWWAVEPDVGGSLDGFSDWLDRNRQLTIQSHKRIMAHVINYEGVKNGNAEKRRAEEILRGLRDRFNPQGFQRKTGGLVRVSSQEVLFAYLCKHTADAADEAWLQLQGKEAFRKGMRSLRTQQELAGSSHRPKQSEQQQGEYPDALQALSRLLARDSREAWVEYCGKDAKTVLSEWGPGWESGIDRVAHGVPARVDRLRGLGNAVVPQVAELVGRMVLQRLGSGKSEIRASGDCQAP
jgi:site-specific DNA-cytosine methylase